MSILTPFSRPHIYHFRGRIREVLLFDHTVSDFTRITKHKFPTAYVKCKKNAAQKVVEVGYNRFFTLSRYVSAPCYTRLVVRVYKRLALLASMLQHVYIDDGWATREYFMWCKEEAYKKENTKETVKCWNLEHLIEAEMLGR